MQRVAKHLYLRGSCYTFRRAIPIDARPAFGGLREYVRSLGDVTEARARSLAAVHNEFCSRLIEEARGRTSQHSKHPAFLQVRRVPERDEIERAVRTWLVEMEEAASAEAIAGQDAQERLRNLRLFDADIIRIMRSGNGETPLMTRWVADALIEKHGWSVPRDGGPLRTLIEDRVARGQRELVARLSAEIAWEDQPQPTHRMFAPHEFLRDREVQTKPEVVRYVPLMEVLGGYFAEQEPAAATVKKWSTAMRSLIEHLGHDDATRVTPDDIVGWKNALLAPDEKGTRARGQMTVRHGYLGAVKPVFAWAVANTMNAGSSYSSETNGRLAISSGRSSTGCGHMWDFAAS